MPQLGLNLLPGRHIERIIMFCVKKGDLFINVSATVAGIFKESPIWFGTLLFWRDIHCDDSYWIYY